MRLYTFGFVSTDLLGRGSRGIFGYQIYEDDLNEGIATEESEYCYNSKSERFICENCPTLAALFELITPELEKVVTKEVTFVHRSKELEKLILKSKFGSQFEEVINVETAGSDGTVSSSLYKAMRKVHRENCAKVVKIFNANENVRYPLLKELTRTVHNKPFGNGGSIYKLSHESKTELSKLVWQTLPRTMNIYTYEEAEAVASIPESLRSWYDDIESERLGEWDDYPDAMANIRLLFPEACEKVALRMVYIIFTETVAKLETIETIGYRISKEDIQEAYKVFAAEYFH